MVLELTPKGQDEEPEELKRVLRAALRHPQAEIFIPAHTTESNDGKVTHYLLEGYAFVRKDLKDAAYLRLGGSQYVEYPLTRKSPEGYNLLSTIDQTEITRMATRVRLEAEPAIYEGDLVFVKSGTYRGITAEVIQDLPEEGLVQIHVKLRSMEKIESLPRSFLQLESRGVRSPDGGWAIFGRIQDKTRWLDAYLAVVRKTNIPPPRPLSTKHREVASLAARLETAEAESLYAGKILDLPTPPGMGPYPWMASTLGKASKIWSFLSVWNLSPPPPLGPYQEDSRIDSWCSRLTTLSTEILDLQLQLATLDDSPQPPMTVLLDGHYFAHRAAHSGKMAELTDGEGRPTGIIYGFLRALGVWVKKYPLARFRVVFDGAPLRRLALCPTYKEGRHGLQSGGGRVGWSQIEVLKGLLPKLGIDVVWHPEEEADDVLATLAKEAAGQVLILTSDQDLLQTVTSDVSVYLVNREKAYTPADVLSEYGVPPEKLPQLRALLGDTSDNLPGVERVPSKVLVALLTTHGTVDGIYASGFPGVTKKQYAYLREATERVKTNLAMMPLLEVPYFDTRGALNLEEATASLKAMDIEPSSFMRVYAGRLRLSRRPCRAKPSSGGSPGLRVHG